MRIENEQTESSMNLNEEIGGRSNSTTLSTDPLTGRHSFLHHVMRKSKKDKKHPSARRREVLLSKISIYIVYMMVCCHRYVRNSIYEKSNQLQQG